MKRISYLLFILLLAATGCGTKANVEGSSESEPPPIKVIEQQNNMQTEMPNDFNFIVRYGYGEAQKNEINTYEHTVTKDLIVKGTATANITFTPEELKSIYEKMREINIMGTKVLAPSTSNCGVIPYNEDSWEIRLNGETKSFTWSEKHCELTNDAKQLLELRTYIQHLVEDKEEYKKLPEAEGGYD
ncbi:hypothetical protein FHS15_003241 [Paenibacillus castaneae]|uniref:hypothetical protein n=1 Tax=Paenibacillus castaneae TaxID=474957 RepID=UPI000C9AFE1F|nr:hypothetical protein [Paenibacillus castaneae]NIK78103.1 hypothetical protein [Paenibacillus castaneae]